MLSRFVATTIANCLVTFACCYHVHAQMPKVNLENAGRESAREIRAAINDAVVGLDLIRENFKVDVSQHISDLNRLLQSAISSVDNASAQRIKQIFDRIDLIVLTASKEANRLVKCAPAITAQEFEDALSKVRVFGFPVILRKSKRAVDNLPSMRFLAISREIEKALDDITEETPAEEVQALHSEIARLAEKTRCFFEELAFRDTLIYRHFLPNAKKAKAWGVVLN